MSIEMISSVMKIIGCVTYCENEFHAGMNGRMILNMSRVSVRVKSAQVCTIAKSPSDFHASSSTFISNG